MAQENFQPLISLERMHMFRVKNTLRLFGESNLEESLSPVFTS